VSPRRVLLAGIAIGGDRFEATAVFRRDRDDNANSHSKSLNQSSRLGIPLNGAIH
jgi:hypothetical protein